MQTRQVFQFVLPTFLRELLTLCRENPAGSVPCMCTPARPAPLPAQILPDGGAARTHVCLALRFGDGSCNGHHSLSVTAPVSSLINMQVNVVPPGKPRGAGTGTYLTGSCMACSHVQQWEKRWNMLGSPARRDSLSSAPTKRAARSVPMLRPPACAFSPWRGASHPRVPRPMAQHCCLQPGAHKPSLGTNPSPLGNTPWARTPRSHPDPAASSCVTGTPVSLSPARPRRVAPAHIPFA